MSKRDKKISRNTELNNSVTASGADAPYDVQAKRLIGIKGVLGHIMVGTIPACRDMNPEEAADCIESEAIIGKVPVDPGLTNTAKRRKRNRNRRRSKNRSRKRGDRIIGMNTENAELYEGMVRYDILFYARIHGDLAQIIINVEIQKQEPTAYPLLNRMLYYACRMVSAQKDRDFTDNHYGDIKSVYSIWICMNELMNSLTHYHMQADHLYGLRKWSGNLDMMNIIVIGVSRELPRRGEQNRLHRLLGALLSDTLTRDKRLDIISNEYALPISEEMERGVNDMCNLAEGLVEHTIERVTRRYILNMHQQGFDISQIASVVEYSEAEVQAVIDRGDIEEEQEDA